MGTAKVRRKAAVRLALEAGDTLLHPALRRARVAAVDADDDHTIAISRMLTRDRRSAQGQENMVSNKSDEAPEPNLALFYGLVALSVAAAIVLDVISDITLKVRGDDFILFGGLLCGCSGHGAAHLSR